MKFIREMIAKKSWSGPASDDFDRDTLQRDLEKEGELVSPLMRRVGDRRTDSELAEELVSKDDDAWDDEDFAETIQNDASDDDAALAVDEAEGPADEDEMVLAHAMAETEATDEAVMAAETDDEDRDKWDIAEFDDDDEEWEIGLSADEDEAEADDDPVFSDKAAADALLEAQKPDMQPAADATGNGAALSDEARDAMDAARHMRSDDDTLRLERSRSEMTDFETDDEIASEDRGMRRRQAIAVMKSAAAVSRRDSGMQDETDEITDEAEQGESLDATAHPVTSDARKSLDAEAELRDALSGLDAEATDDPRTQAAVEEPPMTQKPAPNIWDLQNEAPAETAGKPAENMPDLEGLARAVTPQRREREPVQVVEVPPPALGRAGRQAGRVKTRLLGFQASNENTADPFDQNKAAGANQMFPTGWLVVTDGPGRGNSFAITVGVAQIGRGEDQAVRLDFGDTSISRQNHAAIAYDDEQNTFYLGHGGKSNLVRLNGKPVLSTETLLHGDKIRIGETSLRFIAMCDDDFDWTEDGKSEVGHAASA